MKVSEKYPYLVQISCEACKLDCNACQHCALTLFLTCDLVPKNCALRYNIPKALEGGGS